MPVNTTTRARTKPGSINEHHQPGFDDDHHPITGPGTTVTHLPITDIHEADTPRSTGLNMAHAHALAELDTELPPILIHQKTMRVIDGMHRLTAARLRGQTHIATHLFHGDDNEAFLLAVQLNTKHGLPLTTPDRRTAATRIINTQPHLSDRYIATTTGLSAKTIAALRRETNTTPTTTRLGRDGRQRPLDNTAGRRAAAELITTHPGATLRHIAQQTGISVETARNVRQRLQAGQDPLLDRRTRPHPTEPTTPQITVHLPQTDPSNELRTLLDTIQRDPCLRYTDTGRTLLRWLSTRILLPDEAPTALQHIPPHSRPHLGTMARLSAAAWIQLALNLENNHTDDTTKQPD